MTGRAVPGSPSIRWLLAATLLCYAIGYPVALLAHSVVGWVFVFLGGPLLIALGVATVRQLHRAAEPAESSPERRGAVPPR
jgi:hypothetical protein